MTFAGANFLLLLLYLPDFFALWRKRGGKNGATAETVFVFFIKLAEIRMSAPFPNQPMDRNSFLSHFLSLSDKNFSYKFVNRKMKIG